MAATNKSSHEASKHPYLRRDFQWPEKEESVSLGPILSEQEFEEQIVPEYRKKRTFYFNETLCIYFQVGYYQAGETLKVTKRQLIEDEFTQSYWDNDHKQRWQELREDLDQQITLVNNGTSWWTAETLWIKAKLLR